jgi:type I restriction enzyme S subunit
MHNSFGSNNMARIWDAHTDMGFVYAFLATPFGKLQVCREIYGGVVDHINEPHITSVQIPDIPPAEQRHVGDTVREAFELRDQANDLEDEAIGQIERLIENAGRP